MDESFPPNRNKRLFIEKKINNKGVNFIAEFFFSSVTYHCNVIFEYSHYLLLSYPNFRHTRTISIVYKKWNNYEFSPHSFNLLVRQVSACHCTALVLWHTRMNIFVLKSNRQELHIDQSPAQETCLQPSKEHFISHIYWKWRYFLFRWQFNVSLSLLNFAETHT